MTAIARITDVSVEFIYRYKMNGEERSQSATMQLMTCIQSREPHPSRLSPVDARPGHHTWGAVGNRTPDPDRGDRCPVADARK